MLYEPPKTKQYIIIGAIAIALAVLVILAISLVYKNKTNQILESSLLPKEKLEQQKIQKESDKLDQIRESSGIKSYSSEEINQQSQKLDELRKKIAK